MAVHLADVLARSACEHVTWLEYDAYAKRLAGMDPGSARSPRDVVLTTSDAQRMLRSDVIAVSAEELHRSALDAHTWSGDGEEAVLGLREVWSGEAHEAFLHVASGLHNLFRDGPPLALVVPSPARWLDLVAGEAAASDDDLADFAAMYLADALRPLSAAEAAALVIDEGSSARSLDDLASLYQPVWNVAEHYGWAAGVRVAGARCETAPPAPLAFVLCTETSVSDVAPLWEQSLPVGGGFDRAFWSTDGPLGADVPSHGLGYGTIDPYAEPERVLRRLKAWRGTHRGAAC